MKQYERQPVKKKRATDGIHTGLLAGVILLAFRIPLANKITDMGNGYLAGVWELTNLLCVLFVYGITKSTMVWLRKRGARGQVRLVGKVVSAVGLTGSVPILLLAVLLFVGADGIAGRLFDTKLSGIALSCSAAFLIVIWLSELFRSYFEGMGNSAPCQLSRLIQALGTAIGVLFLSRVCMEYGEKVGNLLLNPQFSYAFGAVGTVAGMTCGMAAALIFLLAVSLLYRGSLHSREMKDGYRTSGDTRKAILSIYRAIPAILAEGSILQCFHMVSVWIYCSVRVTEANRTSAVEILGVYHGKFLVVTALLVFLLVASGNEKIRQIRKLWRQEEIRKAKQLMSEGLSQMIGRSLPVSVSVLCMSEMIVKLLFRSGNIPSQMLAWGSFVIFAASTSLFLWKIMKELEMQRWLFFLQSLALILHTIVLFALLKSSMASSRALALAEAAFWMVFLAGEMVLAFRRLRIPILWKSSFFDPVIGCGMMALVQVLCVKFLPSSWPVLLQVLITAAGGAAFYTVTVILLRGSSRKQMLGSKAGRVLYHILKRFPFFS